MSIARLKRLQRLEKRQSTAAPWVDPFDTAMALLDALQAVQDGRACWIPRQTEALSPEAEEQLALAMRDADRMHERLMAETALGKA
jgi:hypothetical protein